MPKREREAESESERNVAVKFEKSVAVKVEESVTESEEEKLFASSVKVGDERLAAKALIVLTKEDAVLLHAILKFVTANMKGHLGFKLEHLVCTALGGRIDSEMMEVGTGEKPELVHTSQGLGNGAEVSEACKEFKRFVEGRVATLVRLTLCAKKKSGFLRLMHGATHFLSSLFMNYEKILQKNAEKEAAAVRAARRREYEAEKFLEHLEHHMNGDMVWYNDRGQAEWYFQRIL